MALFEEKFISALKNKVERELNYKVTVKQEVEGFFIVKNEENKTVCQISKEALEHFFKKEDLAQLLNVTFDLVKREMNQEFSTSSKEERINNVIPILKNKENTAALSDAVKKDGRSLIYRETNFKDIYIIFAEDFGDVVAYLTQSVLGELDVNEDELYEIAISNLKNKKVYPRHLNAEGLKMTTFSTRDGFDASLLLTLPFKKIEEGMKGDLLVIAPHQDFLAIFDSAEFDDVMQLFFSNIKHYRKFIQSGVSPDILRFKQGKFIEQIRGPISYPLI